MEIAGLAEPLASIFDVCATTDCGAMTRIVAATKNDDRSHADSAKRLKSEREERNSLATYRFVGPSFGSLWHPTLPFG